MGYSSAIETGLSDFHKMIVIVFKTTFQRIPAKIRNYRDYKDFNNEAFRECLITDLAKENIGDSDLNKFTETCHKTLNNHAPSKKKSILGVIKHHL